MDKSKKGEIWTRIRYDLSDIDGKNCRDKFALIATSMNEEMFARRHGDTPPVGVLISHS
jgi:hypothetical protein